MSHHGLKLWIAAGGYSLLWLRLLPAIASCLALVPFFLLVKEFALSRGTVALALAGLIANGTRLYYSHIVRSYSLLLLSAFSLWLFARNSRRSEVKARYSAAYWLVNLGMCWMHYFGLWVVGIQIIVALAFYRKGSLVELSPAKYLSAPASCYGCRL